MTLWRHKDIKSKIGGDLHITVIFRDRWGKVQNGPVDHHATLFFNKRVKFHYGWKYGNWAESRDSPILDAQICLFEQFKIDRRNLYDRRIINRMWS